MKKIGVITFHRSHNCGSIMQSYAMQELLMDYGYKPEFIDFSTQGQKELYAVLRPLKFKSVMAFAKSIYRNIPKVILLRRAKKSWSSYDKYLTTHLNVSSKSYTNNTELIEAEMDYTGYLTGSDQVWNTTIDDFDDAYFLNFVKEHPKIAYAVSQGAKDLNKYVKDVKKYADYVKNIDYVSVREENGQQWLRTLTGNKYPIVLDPTLLHEQSRYSKIEEHHGVPGVTADGYIFIYATPLSWEFVNAIRKYAKQHNLKVVIWHDDIWLKKLGWLTGIQCPKAQNPGKYLDLIKNAKFVCTSSFHGVAFSTIYRKNFVVLENAGMRTGDDDRMTGFLKRLHLFERIVSLEQFEARMSESVDYEGFEKELSKHQTVSRQFLTQALRVKG